MSSNEARYDNDILDFFPPPMYFTLAVLHNSMATINEFK